MAGGMLSSPQNNHSAGGLGANVKNPEDMLVALHGWNADVESLLSNSAAAMISEEALRMLEELNEKYVKKL